MSYTRQLSAELAALASLTSDPVRQDVLRLTDADCAAYAGERGDRYIALDPRTRRCNCLIHLGGRRLPLTFGTEDLAAAHLAAVHGRLWPEICEIVRYADARAEWRKKP